ncbi:hypothetical protein IMZ48_39750 [Candidatus Bathyarchaeota archaeon]|nr:hypothetical protein [Candidatus Bathyarchaeota archaeon]
MRARGTARVNFEASLVTVCVDRGLVRNRAPRNGRRGEREATVLPRRIAVRDAMAELCRAPVSHAAMGIWRHGRRAAIMCNPSLWIPVPCSIYAGSRADWVSDGVVGAQAGGLYSFDVGFGRFNEISGS